MSIKWLQGAQWLRPPVPPHPHATFRVIHQSSYDCQRYACALRTAEQEKRSKEGGGGRGAAFRFGSDQRVFFVFSFPFSRAEPWQKEQMAAAIRDPKQHLPAWGPTVAPGETTWMTQGGMQAYGASARPAPELETPPLVALHFTFDPRRAASCSFIFDSGCTWLKLLNTSF